MAQPGGDQDARSLMPAVIAAAGAGLGGLGLVAAVGGLVTQARFRAAGLPSEVAVSVQSRGYLLAVGGEVLTLAVVVALAIVGAVHWAPVFDPGRVPWTWMLRGERAPRRGWGWLFGADGMPRWRWFLVALAVASMAHYLAWAGRVTRGSLAISLGLAALAIAGSAAATVLARQARRDRDPRRPASTALRLFGLFALIALLGGVAAAAGSLASPRVRPVAVLVDEDPPLVLCGIYVAQTSDSLYIGEVFPEPHHPDRGDHDRGRLIAVSRTRVKRVVVGTSQRLQSVLDARRQSARVSALRAGDPAASRCSPG